MIVVLLLCPAPSLSNLHLMRNKQLTKRYPRLLLITFASLSHILMLHIYIKAV